MENFLPRKNRRLPVGEAAPLARHHTLVPAEGFALTVHPERARAAATADGVAVAHRMDWPRPRRLVSQARGPESLSVMVSARFSRAEANQLAAAAEAAGMSRSAFVRQAALSSAAGKVVDVVRVRRSVDEAKRQLSAAREALG